jgi:hypothetical protein
MKWNEMKWKSKPAMLIKKERKKEKESTKVKD